MRNIILITFIIALISIAGCGQKITGQAVGDVAACSDSDGGNNKDLKGTVSGILANGENFIYSDECIAGLLIEYYCDDKTPRNNNYRCPNECSNGACV